jgi:ABC-type nitrate/sulfonate/bicarbonate transport system substrate-binding protein
MEIRTAMPKIKNKVVLSVVLSLFCSTVGPASITGADKPQQKLTIGYAAITPMMAGLWTAQEIGAFEKYGLYNDLVYIVSGSTTVQALVSGDLHLAFPASNAVVSAIVAGAPLVALGTQTNRPAMSLWVSPEIRRAEQLQGKTLGITRPGSVTHFVTLMVIEKLGLKNQVKLQAFGGTPEADNAFRMGAVAGRVTTVKPMPSAHALVPVLDIPFSQGFIVAQRDFYKKSPKIVEGFFKGYIEGLAAFRTRRDVGLKVLAKYMRRQDEVLNDYYEIALKFLEPVPKTDPAVIQTVLNWIEKPDVPVTAFYDNSVIERLERQGFISQVYSGAKK